MEWMIEKELSYSRLVVTVTRLGKDYHVVVQGGEKPHIGCVVLAIPRPSLTGDGSVSVTSSVLNVTGHKDEELCRHLAEMLARKKNAVTVCTGGFHVDHIQKEQIDEVTAAIREIERELEQL
ncbi:MAG: hypothetical protein ACI4TF_02865 [Oliverpabstia sp.]